MDLSRGVLVTGADGQLGAALCEEFATDTRVVGLTRAEWDVTMPPAVHDVDLLVDWHADPEISRYWDDETYTREQILSIAY